MTLHSPFNLFIAGVGGQGVATLAQVFRLLSERSGYPCNGAIIKGGAQRLGRITASLRIFLQGDPDYRNYSTEIPAGGLDLLIGLEPWEALKSAGLCHPQTRLIVNSDPVPLMIARSQEVRISDPIEALRALGLSLSADKYGSNALTEYGSRKMLNFVIGDAAIREGMPFFGADEYEACFRECIDKKM